MDERSWRKLTDKIESLSKEISRRFNIVHSWFMSRRYFGMSLSRWLVNQYRSSKQVIFRKRALMGRPIIFSDHANHDPTSRNFVTIFYDSWSLLIAWTSSGCPVNQYEEKRVSLFSSEQRSRKKWKVFLMSKLVNWPKQGSLSVLDDRCWKRTLPNLDSKGIYIATFDQQAPTIDEIF